MECGAASRRARRERTQSTNRLDDARRGQLRPRTRVDHVVQVALDDRHADEASKEHEEEVDRLVLFALDVTREHDRSQVDPQSQRLLLSEN